MESATKPSFPSSPFSQSLLTAPNPQSSPDLPEGSQWRYSEFLNAVKKGKVEHVRFSKDGGALQLTAVDGRRATVVVPNDPDLIYFLLFLVYAAVWVAILLRKRLAAFCIHYFMLAVVVLKALNLLCEAEDKSYIKHTDSAHGCAVLFPIV